MHSPKILAAFVILFLLASCSSDPVTPGTTEPEVSGMVTDSSGVPVSGAAIHVLHIINSESYADGGNFMLVRFLVRTQQTISAALFAPDGSLDTTISFLAQPGVHSISLTPPFKMNGISTAIVTGQTFIDTTYYITESVDQQDLSTMKPLAITDAQGKFSIPKSSLHIGTLVQNYNSDIPDTIASHISFLIMHTGYHGQLVTMAVTSDSSQQQNVILKP